MDARRVADTWRPERSANGRPRPRGSPGLAVVAHGRLRDARRAIVPAGRVARPATRASRRRSLLGGAIAAGLPSAVGGDPAPQGRGAAESPESFYGLLARESLGMDTKLAPDPFLGFDPPVDQLPNVQRAMELVRVGEPALAEELLRHQAKIGAPVRTSCPDPARQAARSSRGAAIARQQRPVGRPRRLRPTAIPTRAGTRSTAGGSIPPSPSATSSRNRRFAGPRSAPPVRSA